jgi:hypothetical protein
MYICQRDAGPFWTCQSFIGSLASDALPLILCFTRYYHRYHAFEPMFNRLLPLIPRLWSYVSGVISTDTMPLYLCFTRYYYWYHTSEPMSIIRALMVYAARTTATSVDIQLRMRQYIPEDSEPHTYRRENLISHGDTLWGCLRPSCVWIQISRPKPD